MAKASTTPVTPKALALELNVDPKRVRAYLRRNHGRPAEAKNSAWTVTAAQANDVRKAFAPKA